MRSFSCLCVIFSVSNVYAATREIKSTGNRFSLAISYTCKEGFSKPTDFFSAFREVKNSSLACLPVFFKLADAWMIRRRAFELLAEMNPQESQELMILTSAPPVVTAVISLRKDYDADKARVIDMLRSTDTDPQGKQRLLFRMTKLVPSKPEYLSSLEAMLTEHQELVTKVVSRK